MTKQPLDPNGKAVKEARKWLKALRKEARTRYDYTEAATYNPSTAKVRAARKQWEQAHHDWSKLRLPSDEAIKIAKDK